MNERQYSNEASSLSTLSCFSSIYLGKNTKKYIFRKKKYVSCSMLKILQTRLQQYVNREFPDVQAEFRKGRGTRDQIANIRWIIKKSKRVPEKYLLLFYPLCQSLWLWVTTNCGKFFKRWEYQTTWPASWEICLQIKRQQLELDMEPQTGSE